MAKVTGKFQLTLPKALAEQCGIRVGDDVDVRSTGRSIQLTRRPSPATRAVEDRLAHFDRATARQRARGRRPKSATRVRSRGWKRQDLYLRGRPR
jgi:AbrB family looped-hinge helix DNA binding protein